MFSGAALQVASDAVR